MKYTREGGVTLSLTGERDVSDDRYAVLHFAVKDTGIGIRKEDISRLFSEYVRIDMERNRYIEGTGLGISISRQLLHLMGSSLHVESKYGEGSTFYFDLRQKVIDGQPMGDFRREQELQSADDYFAASYMAPEAKILVVDDNDMNRKVFRNLLRQTKIQISDVSSGRECLELVAREHFDLIFMDHMMPEMDGIQTFHRMEQLETNLCQDTPVVMLTANAIKGAKEQYINEGFRDFLAKPIMPDKLDEMVLKYLPEELVGVVLEDTDEANGVRAARPGGTKDEPVQRIDLPELEEFDYEYAIGLLRDRALLKEALVDFYRTIPGLAADLSLHESMVEQEESLNAYRIQVHALKSTAATVGALLLSKLARLLEVAAREGDTRKIHVLHPILLEELEKHRKRLEVLMPKNENRKLLNMEEVSPLFEMLRKSLSQEDYNMADYLIGKLEEYIFPDALQELMEMLGDQILNLEADEAIDTIDQVRDRLDTKNQSDEVGDGGDVDGSHSAGGEI